MKEEVHTSIALQTVSQVEAVGALIETAGRTELILQEIIHRRVTTGAC